MRIDLNADVGESYGHYRIGDDANLFRFVTSASIACGLHAGDPSIMRRTVDLAREHGVAIGAHPGYPDLQGFGRRNMDLTYDEVRDAVLYQIGALEGFVRAAGGRLQHVKPHGALYNTAARLAPIAEAIADAVGAFSHEIILVGLPGSEMERAAAKAGLRFAPEAFADRTYQADGSLTPRRDSRAMVTDPSLAARRALAMIRHGVVEAVTGDQVPLRAETLCVHGDTQDALAFARQLATDLQQAGVALVAMGAEMRPEMGPGRGQK